MARSSAAEARIEVSLWLKDTALMVSVDVGHCSVWLGTEAGRDRSYIEIILEDAAIAGRLR